jgi:hypothetical protein
MILIPLAIIGLIGTAGIAQHTRTKKAADPRTLAERMVIYKTAIGADDPSTALKDPNKLRSLANSFRSEGMSAEADMLEKRAALQERPTEVKEAHKEAFRQGMASTDPDKVIALAEAFDSMGCTGAAGNLRKYASGLTTATVATEEIVNEQA